MVTNEIEVHVQISNDINSTNKFYTLIAEFSFTCTL